MRCFLWRVGGFSSSLEAIYGGVQLFEFWYFFILTDPHGTHPDPQHCGMNTDGPSLSKVFTHWRLSCWEGFWKFDKFYFLPVGYWGSGQTGSDWLLGQARSQRRHNRSRKDRYGILYSQHYSRYRTVCLGSPEVVCTVRLAIGFLLVLSKAGHKDVNSLTVAVDS